MQRKVLFLCLILIICISCLCSPASALSRVKQFTPSAPPPAEFLAPINTYIPPTEEPTAAELPTETTSLENDSSAPFLVLSTANSLLVADENGDNMHPLISDVVIVQPLNQLIQPNGHLLAVIQKVEDRIQPGVS